MKSEGYIFVGAFEEKTRTPGVRKKNGTFWDGESKMFSLYNNNNNNNNLFNHVFV